MAAINLAKRVAAERGESLGQTVGYRIGGDSVVGLWGVEGGDLFGRGKGIGVFVGGYINGFGRIC